MRKKNEARELVDVSNVLVGVSNFGCFLMKRHH